MIGTALTLNPIDGRAGVFSLQTLLERRLIVAQSGTGTQLLCELLDGVARNIAARESANRLQTTVEEEGADDGFHRVGENRALAPQPLRSSPRLRRR